MATVPWGGCPRGEGCLGDRGAPLCDGQTRGVEAVTAAVVMAAVVDVQSGGVGWWQVTIEVLCLLEVDTSTESLVEASEVPS
mmetsp:Transcript_110200/g.275929  ORF Transcript_110200/g.275929 Transcript_110200/m.275929 type:complete len:82 (+) Transcript_110200:128-373(+)